MDTEQAREGKFLSSRILNDGCKCATWRNANYCFAVTAAIVLLNIILYAVCGSDTGDFSVRHNWGNFSVNNLFQALVNSYSHSNWQHVLLNMLCFLFAGVYLERKKGSLPFLLFMALMSLFTAFAVCTNDISVARRGFSGVNYGLYGYIGIEYIFTLLLRRKRDIINIVAGAVMLGLIYFAMCFNGGTSSIGFEWYPYDLLHNLAHASGFVAGLMLGIVEQGTEWLCRGKRTDTKQ